MISFDITNWDKTYAFKDDYNIIPYNIYGYGQAYTQINQNLYIIHPNPGNKFLVYQLADPIGFQDKFDTGINVADVTFPITVGDAACLAQTNMYLFITGGRRDGDNNGGILNTTQVYHISENKWVTVKAMIEPRYHHACLVTNSNPFGFPTEKPLYLYVIGGNNGTGYSDSIHRLKVSNMGGIQEESWERLDVRLKKGRMRLRANYDHLRNLIYVVGGMRMMDSLGLDYMIDIINVTMEHDRDALIMVDADKMVYTLSGTGLILVDDILYAFGGGKGTNTSYGDCWQYCQLYVN